MPTIHDDEEEDEEQERTLWSETPKLALNPKPQTLNPRALNPKP